MTLKEEVGKTDKNISIKNLVHKMPLENKVGKMQNHEEKEGALGTGKEKKEIGLIEYLEE